MKRFILEPSSKIIFKKICTLKETFPMKKEELHDEYESITMEEAINIMTRNHGDDPSSYVLRDTNGEVVTDPESIKIARDAMAKFNDSKFEYGGHFKTIIENQNKEIRKNKKQYIVGMVQKPKNIEYCPCCGEPFIEDD
jgi:hypothetical protein